jgi:hypothetical protein
LAENALAKVYEARDVIRWARSTAGFSGEGSSRLRAEGEEAKQASALDSLYIPVERLKSESELFAQIESLNIRS